MTEGCSLFCSFSVSQCSLLFGWVNWGSPFARLWENEKVTSWKERCSTETYGIRLLANKLLRQWTQGVGISLGIPFWGKRKVVPGVSARRNLSSGQKSHTVLTISRLCRSCWDPTTMGSEAESGKGLHICLYTCLKCKSERRVCS